MRYYKLCIFFLLFISPVLAFAHPRVAIFDYDNRSQERMPQNLIISNEILKIVPAADISLINPCGDEDLAIRMAGDIDRQGFDLIIVITTDGLRIARHLIVKTPFLFTDVYNPLMIGYQSLKKPGGNSSGVTYYVPVEIQMDFFRRIKRNMKTIGFIFDRNALSRTFEIQEARDYCVKHRLKFEKILIDQDSEIDGAVQSLISKKADCIVLTSSGKVYNHTDRILKYTNPLKIPVFSFNRQAVVLGALASYTSDYTLMNTRILPNMIRRVLINHEWPGDIPVGFLPEPIMTLNYQNASLLGITFPEEWKGTARDINR